MQYSMQLCNCAVVAADHFTRQHHKQLQTVVAECVDCHESSLYCIFCEIGLIVFYGLLQRGQGGGTNPFPDHKRLQKT